MSYIPVTHYLGNRSPWGPAKLVRMEPSMTTNGSIHLQTSSEADSALSGFIVLYCITLCFGMQYFVSLYYTVLWHTVLCSFVLYYTTFYLRGQTVPFMEGYKCWNQSKHLKSSRLVRKLGLKLVERCVCMPRDSNIPQLRYIGVSGCICIQTQTHIIWKLSAVRTSRHKNTNENHTFEDITFSSYLSGNPVLEAQISISI